VHQPSWLPSAVRNATRMPAEQRTRRALKLGNLLPLGGDASSIVSLPSATTRPAEGWGFPSPRRYPFLSESYPRGVYIAGERGGDSISSRRSAQLVSYFPSGGCRGPPANVHLIRLNLTRVLSRDLYNPEFSRIQIEGVPT
jgi:hypothetical protein